MRVPQPNYARLKRGSPALAKKTFRLPVSLLPALVALTCLGLQPCLALAQGTKVAIVHSADKGDALDVQEILKKAGAFSEVDSVRLEQGRADLIITGFPMKKYGSILIFLDDDVQDSRSIGDFLADLVDAGVGVVIAMFSNYQNFVGGRFTKYSPIQLDSSDHSATVQIGKRYLPQHPLLRGVKSFGGTDIYRSLLPRVHPKATRVADWDDGSALVVLRNDFGAPVVALNFFPPSSRRHSDYWDINTDGDKILVNALKYAAKSSPFAPKPKPKPPGKTPKYDEEFLASLSLVTR